MKTKRFTYLMISICIVIIVSIMAIVYINIQQNDENELIRTSGKITDECTEEWDEYVALLNNTAQVSSEEDVVSPNAKLLFKSYYKSCGHVETKTEIVSEEIVNMSKEQLKEKYADYEIEDFLKEEIKLYKEIDGLCDKHYLLIEEEGYIDIYKLENDGEQTLISKTNISSEYLTEMDQVKLKQGIYVYGIEELNSTLEDFE